MMKLLFAATLAIVVLFSACKKDELTTAQTEQIMAAEDQTSANDLYEDVDEQVDQAIQTRGGSGTCPTVTIDPADGSYPRTMTVDFGPDGCTGPDGRVRKGQIVVTLTDTLTNLGAIRTATFVDFYVDNAHVEGIRTVTNVTDYGPNSDGNLSFTRTVTGGKITFPNGETTSWDASHVITLVQGLLTPTLVDNVWEITGGSSGVNRHGKSFTTEIVTPLVRKGICPWIVSGTKTLTLDGKTATVDYGDGTCDRKATVVLPNGTTKQILIRWWM